MKTDHQVHVLWEFLLQCEHLWVVATVNTRNIKILNKLRHIAPPTYARLGWLSAIYKTTDFQTFLKEDLHFEDSDIKKTGRYLKEAWEILHSNCLKGRLHLDLDIDSHLNGDLAEKQDKKQCDILFDPKKAD